MSQKWDRIANQEFESMSKSAQRDWAELRKKVERS